MTNSIVVVSSIVDATVQEYQKDIKFYLFKTLEELDEYVQHTPIRAGTMFFTRDVIPLRNTSLNFLVDILDRVFFRVDKIIYITEPGSDEIESVQFLIDDQGYKNWEIIKGALTRDYVTSVINGSARDDFTNAKRKAVYRIPKDSYVRSRTRQSEMMESEVYRDDDEQIQEMPDEKMPVYVPPERDTTCECYDIVGDDSIERTAFSFIMAQYLATRGKTLIVERDWEFHTLGECITKSGVKCGIFYIDDLIHEPLYTMERILDSQEKLIALICRRKFQYNYSFVFNLLYSRLIDKFTYAVREDVFGEEPTEGKYTVVFQNTMTGLLSMCKGVNMNFIKYTKFVGIHMDTLKELRLPTGASMQAIIEDVLNTHDILPVELVAVSSLVMGKDSTYDLRSVLWI